MKIVTSLLALSHLALACQMEQDGRRPFELVYHGQFDDSRPSNNIPVTGRFVIYVTAFKHIAEKLLI